MVVSENPDNNKTHKSLKDIIYFIIRFIMILVISYIYVEGMMKLTVLHPGDSVIFFGIKRGVLIFLHIDLNFKIVKLFFQNEFPFINKKIGLIVALISWLTGLILALLLNP